MLRQMVHAFDARVGSGVSRERVGGGVSLRRLGPHGSWRRAARQSRSAPWVERAPVGAWLALTLTALPSLAAAQQGATPPARFVVVPVTVAGVSSEPVSAVRDALARHGETLDGAAAAARFETAHSATAHSIEASEIDAWAARSRTALRYLSRGEYGAARTALLEAQGLSERAAEALNRETARARHVLDTCLFVARASLETGDRVAAEEQARRCRRLVPRMQATPTTHPPEVRALLARVDAELTSEDAGALVVTSSPSGCTVRINGVYFGSTPLTTNELGLGSYRVQVECDDATEGRVHTVDLGNADAHVDVDVAFEAAVRTTPTLALSYSQLGAADARLVHDASLLAAALEATVVAVVQEGGHARLVRVDPEGTSASARVALSGPPEARDSAISALVLGQIREEDAPPERSRVRAGFGAGRKWRRIAGATLLGSGIAASGLALGLLIVRNDRGDAYASTQVTDPSYLDSAASYDRARAGVYASSVFGAVLATTGVVVATPGRRVPWYGYSLGAVGVGLVAFAIADAATAPHCDDGAVAVATCVARDRAFARAALVAGLGAPLVAVPLSQLGHTRASVTADRSSVFVSIRSTF